MKPGKLDLPTIWRGCAYQLVRIDWKDNDGNPIDVSGWTPTAYTRDFQFLVEVPDPVNGKTAIRHPATQNLKLGVTNWDFIWTQNDAPNTVSIPFLKGSVEIKEPVTDPRTHVAGRIGGGSVYVKMFVKDDQPDRFISLVGRYHQTFAPSPQVPVPIAPLARDQISQMAANGQTKITIYIQFIHAYLSVPDPQRRIDLEYINGVFLIPFNPSGVEGDVNVRMTDQQTLNLVTLMNDIKAAGFTQMDVRFGPAGPANTEGWTGGIGGGQPIWIQERYEHNRNFILSIIAIVETNKNDLTVVYDLGQEHARNIMLAVAIPPDPNQPLNDVHRQYCRFLWAAYCNIYGPHNSMAFSILGQFNSGYFPGKTPIGLIALTELLTTYHLPYPGYYGADLYGRDDGSDTNFTDVYHMLVDGYDYLKANYGKKPGVNGEETKPYIIQETFYNDQHIAIQVDNALGDRTNLNIQSLFQWPTQRGHGPPNYTFPDSFPRAFAAYQTL